MKRGQPVNIDRNTMPAALTPKGVDPARQWYLYQEIRPFCKDTSDTLQSCVIVESEKRKFSVKLSSPEC